MSNSGPGGSLWSEAESSVWNDWPVVSNSLVFVVRIGGGISDQVRISEVAGKFSLRSKVLSSRTMIRMHGCSLGSFRLQTSATGKRPTRYRQQAKVLESKLVGPTR